MKLHEMSKRDRTVAVIAFVGAGALTGQAAAEPIDRGALEALFEEPITLSATGAPQRVTDAPVNMTIITQDEIRRSGAVDLPGVLERLASIDVMRSSRGQADVTIRGYNTTLAPRLLVLLNGRQVYLDHYGVTNWNAIPVQLAEIRQIEVVSGPNTALFGFNAVAGVVNIITYDALHDDVDQVSATLGSPEYGGVSGIWTGRLSEQLGVRFSVGGFDAESSAEDDAYSQLLILQNARDSASRTAALNVAYDITPHVRADLEATWSRNDRAGRYFNSLLAEHYETNSLKLGLSGDTSLGIFETQIYVNNLDLITFTVAGRTPQDIRTIVASASLVAKPAPAHTLRAGAEYRRNTLAQGFGDELRYDVYALSGMWNWQVNDALALTSALRVDALGLERSGPAATPTFPFGNADYDQDMVQGSVNLGAVYRVTPTDSLRFAAGRGVASPSLNEYGIQKASTFGPLEIFFAGDPEIAPTIVYNVELGWDHDLPTLNGRLRASAFWQRNEDLKTLGITTIALSPTTLMVLADNFGDSEMVGVELGATGEVGPLHFRAQYSWRQIDDQVSLAPNVVGLDYEGSSPEHVLTGGLTWIGDRWEFGADARYTSETLQYGLVLAPPAPTPAVPAGAYTQFNAHIAWLPSAGVRVELSARDLLEPRTQTVGLAPVERSLYLTISRRFGVN